MRTRALHALVLALIFAGTTSVVACSEGGNGDGAPEVSAEEQPYVDAVSASLDATDEDELQLSKEQRDCFGARYVDIVGVEKLKAAGVDPEKVSDDQLNEVKLTDDQGGEVYDSFEACKIDLREEITQSLAADSDLTDEQKACFDDALSEENLRKMVTLGFGTGSGPDEESALENPKAMEAIAPIMACAFMGLDKMGEEMGEN